MGDSIKKINISSMILINDSLTQIIILFFLSLALPKQKFYIVFKYKSKILLKILIYFLDFISASNFKYESIKFFRSSYPFLSDQRSINSICKYYEKILKKNKRYGGQIYIENELRTLNWENSVTDEIFNYFLEKSNKDSHSKLSNHFSYKLLLKIRNLER